MKKSTKKITKTNHNMREKTKQKKIEKKNYA